MIRRVCLTAAFVALAAAAGIGQQQPPPSLETPTFKAEVEYVEVDALVTDAQGRFIRDLTKDDFQVFEDGQRQTVSTFTLVDLPIERAGAAAVRRGADRTRRALQRAAIRRPRLRRHPRRPAYRCAPHDAGEDGDAAVHRAQPRRQRPDGGRPHRRPHRCGTGVHQQQAAAPGVGRQVHGPQAGLGDHRPQRPVLPSARRGARGFADRRSRRTGARLQRAVDDAIAEGDRRVAQRPARPAQDDHLRERGDRLRHHRRHPPVRCAEQLGVCVDRRHPRRRSTPPRGPTSPSTPSIRAG